jgi:hypothetical protein
MEETTLTPASEWEIYLEYKNPSALVEHREACPIVRQVLKVVVVG